MTKRRLRSRTGAAMLTLVAAGGASIALAATATLTADATAASHTLRFTSAQISERDFAGNHFVDADKDVAKHKVMGFDVVDGVFHAKTRTITLDFAGALDGGVIYAHGTGNARTGKFTGKVDGGTGTFKGVRGKVTGQAFGTQDQNEKLVITYHR